MEADKLLASREPIDAKRLDKHSLAVHLHGPVKFRRRVSKPVAIAEEQAKFGLLARPRTNVEAISSARVSCSLIRRLKLCSIPASAGAFARK